VVENTPIQYVYTCCAYTGMTAGLSGRLSVLSCPAINLIILWRTVFIFGIEISHDFMMTPIVFEVTGSKVTGSFSSKSIAAQLLENSLVNIFGIEVGYD
jgi:hypothetical protein